MDIKDPAFVFPIANLFCAAWMGLAAALAVSAKKTAAAITLRRFVSTVCAGTAVGIGGHGAFQFCNRWV